MIKQPWALAISGIFLFIAVYYVVERAFFIMSAEKTLGSVVKVESYNSRCGGGKRRSKYDCTKFTSYVRYFNLKNSPYEISLSSGSSRGHNQPDSYARLKMGESVPIIYDPKNPAKAYEDTIWGVWGVPIMLFFGQICSFLISISQPKTRGYRIS